MSESGAAACPTCEGVGWVVDHSEECYEASQCVGCAGVQVLCTDPQGHADPCTRCDGNGQTWDPTADGNVAACLHCVGGWVWRGDIRKEWRA